MSSAGGVRRVAVITGTRAEFGLLRPVMRAVRERDGLDLVTIVAGSHLVGDAPTVREVQREFKISARVPMQASPVVRGGRAGRLDDARALARGIGGIADALEILSPDWVVVLGDRIEAFAGAAAAGVGGIACAHIHGGDRAEGVADESMRSAISRLAHLHFGASRGSCERLERWGEDAWRVLFAGSPSLDDLDGFPAVDDEAWEALGRPEAVFLMHPIGRDDADEERASAAALRALHGVRVLALDPNLDPGRAGIIRAIERSGAARAAHLERPVFVGLLKRVGLLVGNSSAGLIEAAACGCAAVNVGRRQSGRERAANVVDAPDETEEQVRVAVQRAGDLGRGPFEHPYGDGRAGERIAAWLAGDPAPDAAGSPPAAVVDPHDPNVLRKVCAY